jgi:biotin carboxylase
MHSNAESSKKELIFVESVASGHGPLSIPIAQDCGFSVAFFAENPDFYQTWGVKEPLSKVERIVVTDTSDVEAMLPHVDKERTAGIVALDDFHLIPASELAARFGLPHPNIIGLQRARFKDMTRERLREFGERRPRFVVFTDSNELHDSPVGYPCVIKPTDGTGSVGVQICWNQAELKEALPLLRERWKTVRGYSLSARWLLEEYVEGPEYSAELMWNNGSWHLLGITRKILSDLPYAVEVGHVFPATLPNELYTLVQERAIAWLEAIELDFGAAHIEFRICDGEPILMEINPRLGGDMLPELIRLACNFNELEHLFQLHTGSPVTADLSTIQVKQAVAIRFLISNRPGIVQEIHGREKVMQLPYVTRCFLRGTPIKLTGTESSYDRLGYVIATGSTSVEAEANVLHAINQLQVVQE